MILSQHLLAEVDCLALLLFSWLHLEAYAVVVFMLLQQKLLLSLPMVMRVAVL